ncbi:Uncharacterised protein [Mycobacteroides abscessus subsp. abscessus]|nr:Uncharacterised protein [Mycobacteroides abscessus subsp. abscessus]
MYRNASRRCDQRVSQSRANDSRVPIVRSNSEVIGKFPDTTGKYLIRAEPRNCPGNRPFGLR